MRFTYQPLHGHLTAVILSGAGVSITKKTTQADYWSSIWKREPAGSSIPIAIKTLLVFVLSPNGARTDAGLSLTKFP